MGAQDDSRLLDLTAATLLGVEAARVVGDEDSAIALLDDLVVGRDAARAGLVLAHPSVSRSHARFERRDAHWMLEDLDSMNGTFLNGRRVGSPARVEVGDRIDIGPFSYEVGEDRLERTTRSGSQRISAKRVTFDAARGLAAPTRILDDVSLCIEPNEFVCILGPSGSGKSTLLDLLAGRRAASYGSVRVNGLDLHLAFDALKHSIAHVPQHDILHVDLTIERALTYTARLRLPADSSAEEIARAVDDALTAVQLEGQRDRRIRELSGGQRRRASLASEIVCRPQILFIDEATSGLDEHTDLEMMRLFRRLADYGMTVVCITHNLANVERTAHLVAILAAGGTLTFVGKPSEALDHFDVSDLGRIYKRLADRSNEEWRDDFLASEACERYVESRLSSEPAQTLTTRLRAELGPAPWRERRRQFGILMRRSLELLTCELRSLAFSLLSAWVIAIILVLVFRDAKIASSEEATLHFLVGTVAVWLGCSNAAKELVKEREIYRKERDARLDPLAYLAARFVVLALLAFAQVALITMLLTRYDILGFDRNVALGLQWLAAITGSCLGLVLSAIARSSEQASSLVPIALIPQIVLSGFVVSHLPAAVDRFSHLAISNYAVHRAIEAVVAGDSGEMWSEVGRCVAQCFVGLTLAAMLLRRRG